LEIHYFATVPLKSDEPASCIPQFVEVLRTCTIDSGKAEVDLNLVGTSARARTTIQEFQPHRTNGASFPEALQITGELTKLGPAKIKSLHFLLSADKFRWKGSIPSSSGRLALRDAKSFHRKQRFHLSAHLLFNALSSEEDFIAKMLAEIVNETGIRFEKEASIAAFQPNESGRATPEQLLATVLAWNELIETVGKKVRQEISLASVPHLMTTHQAHDFLFDPAKLGKSVRVDFSRIVRRWLKEEFPDYKSTGNFGDGELLQKGLAEGLITTLHVDKRPKAFSKEFTVLVGVGLTSQRFAPTTNQPLQLSVNLFHLFGIGPLPMQWTYSTESDLREALDGCASTTRKVLAAFEPEAVKMQHAHKRGLEEFPGPRELSAREAYEAALPLAMAWAEDAGLIRANAGSVLGPYLAHSLALLPALGGEGRLAMNGAWNLTFHSPKKRENLYVTVPHRGSITTMRSDAPIGRQWPSDSDQIFRESWIDSVEALWLARAKTRELIQWNSLAEPQMFELSSRANLLASAVIMPPRDGMFKMDTSWRISFDRREADSRSIAIITVPAYGDAEPAVEEHRYDKHGRPSKL
jgi:hypothetical protein